MVDLNFAKLNGLVLGLYLAFIGIAVYLDGALEVRVGGFLLVAAFIPPFVGGLLADQQVELLYQRLMLEALIFTLVYPLMAMLWLGEVVYDWLNLGSLVLLLWVGIFVGILVADLLKKLVSLLRWLFSPILHLFRG